MFSSVRAWDRRRGKVSESPVWEGAKWHCRLITTSHFLKRRREVQLRRIAKGSKEESDTREPLSELRSCDSDTREPLSELRSCDSDTREPLSELRSCVKVEEAVLSGVPSLISLMVYKCGRKAILNFNS